MSTGFRMAHQARPVACQGPDYKIGQLTYTGGDVLSVASWVKKSTPIADGSPNLGVPVSTSTVLAPASGESVGTTVPVDRLQSYNASDRYIRHDNYLLR
jgi:hypothetical protein